MAWLRPAMVAGVKRGVNAQREKSKARAVICGNFQETSAHEELYTANADITSVRAVLAASVPGNAFLSSATAAVNCATTAET